MKILDCNTVFGGIRKEAEFYDPLDVLKLMDKAGIDQALTASTIGYLGNDVLANDETAAICSSEKRLLPVGTINPTTYTDVEQEIIKRKEQKFVAFRLFTEHYDVDFESMMIKDYFSLLEKHNMPLIVSASDMKLSANYLDGIARRALDVSIPVIVLNVTAYKTASLIECAKYVPNLYFATRLLYLFGGLEYLCETIGSERLVLGSGIPYHYAMQSIYYIHRADIQDSDRENILYKNLERVILHDN